MVLSVLGICSSAQAQTLDKVKASGSITVAYRESSIPFSYLGGDAQPVGFAWEICGKLVEQVKKATGRADLKVSTQAVTSQNRIPLLQNGTIDIECGSTTNNSERGKQVQFATNYFYTGTRFLVKAGTQVKSIEDLKGKTIGLLASGGLDSCTITHWLKENGVNCRMDPKWYAKPNDADTRKDVV